MLKLKKDHIGMYNNEGKDESSIDCEDEIYTNCTICQCKRLAAYWDDELESYIYLSDEPAVCVKCSSSTEFFPEETQALLQAKTPELVS